MGSYYTVAIAITKMTRGIYYAIAEMYHTDVPRRDVPRRDEPRSAEPEPPTTMQQYVAYNQLQWQYFNELFAEVHAGNYGAYYNFLLAELDEGHPCFRNKNRVLISLVTRPETR